MTKPSVLIVEDDAQLGLVFSKTLEADFETHLAPDGGQAIALLPKLHPDLVLLDLNLPGRPGRDVLTAIRADERLAATRIILCTADERQADSLQDQADMILLKPVSPTQLRQIALRLRPAPVT